MQVPELARTTPAMLRIMYLHDCFASALTADGENGGHKRPARYVEEEAANIWLQFQLILKLETGRRSVYNGKPQSLVLRKAAMRKA